MLKQLKVSVLALLAVAFLASCANDSDVREKARQSVTPSTTVTPEDGLAASMDDDATIGVQPMEPAGPTTSMTFKETTFDFGSVDAGEKVRHVYKFTNSGKEPLLISNARGSCGCTVPQWPKEAIQPGADGEIVVEFDSGGKSGRQTKTVTLTANTDPAQTTLTITGEVIGKSDASLQVQ